MAANTLSSYRRDLRRYFEHLTSRDIDDLAKVSEDDVSEFLVARPARRSGVRGIAAIGGVGGTDLYRGAWPAPVRHRGGPGRIRRGSGRQATDTGAAAAQSLSLDQVLALLARAGRRVDQPR